MIKVVVISDGDNFIIDNYKLEFVNMQELLALCNFYKAESLDSLWQDKDRDYLVFLELFYKKFNDFDIIICDQINPLHPEWLKLYFGKAIKIYGMIDDPVCTYHRTLSEIWAFDGVFYVSPGYNEYFTTEEFIKSYNPSLSSHFLPHARYNSFTSEHDSLISSSFDNREKGVLYVGQYYDSKIDRLIELNKSLGSEFDVFGHWPYKGYKGYLRALQFKVPFLRKVNWLTEEEKFLKFTQYKICFNMHWNKERETGNMRMYQAPFYGMMLLSDKAAKNQHEIIFDDTEAVFYENIDEAIDMAKYYLGNDNARIEIAKRGYYRAKSYYTKETVWRNLLNWAFNLKNGISQ